MIFSDDEGGDRTIHAARLTDMATGEASFTAVVQYGEPVGQVKPIISVETKQLITLDSGERINVRNLVQFSNFSITKP